MWGGVGGGGSPPHEEANVGGGVGRPGQGPTTAAACRDSATRWLRKKRKNCRKKGKQVFSQKHVFRNLEWYLGSLGVSGGMACTIRCDSLELWPGLVLHGMGEVDVHVFWKYWKLTSSPNTIKLVLGPPGWSSDFC